MIDGIFDECLDPVIAVSNNHDYIIWGDRQPNPDSSLDGGLYLSSFDSDNVAINGFYNNLPCKPSLDAYPNPFNSSTTIAVSNQAECDLSIFDIGGRLQATLHIVNGKTVWDASGLPAGIYFAGATISGQRKIIKLIYLK